MRSLLALLLLLLGLGGGGLYLYREALQQPFQLSQPVIFQVQRGEGIASIARQLHEQAWIKNHWALIVYAHQHDLARKIKAGSYRLDGSMSVQQFLQDLVDGRVVVQQFRLLEGKRFRDLRQQLREDAHLKQTLEALSEAEIAQRLQLPTAEPEGWFLPETYHIEAGSSDLELLQRMHRALRDYLLQAWKKRDPDLPLKTPYEALILASLIEKETGKDSERAEIAGVFLRRLQKNMRLQTDPSVIYGVENYPGYLTKKHLQTDHPHNTYTRHGLPPTPIAMVSRASIDAALHPAPGEALYFVADGRGGHVFSRSYEEHLQAAKAYRDLQKK